MTEPADLFLAMAGRPTVVTDIDNVLAFFAEAALTALNTRFGTSTVVGDLRSWPLETQLHPQHRTWLLQQLQRGAFYETLAPDFTAIATMSMLHRHGFRVLATSDRPVSAAEATARWIQQWDIEVDELVLRGPGSKGFLIDSEGFGPDNPAVLIDDDPAKIALAGPGVEVWSPLRPWTPDIPENTPHYWVFPSWEAVLDRLTTIPTSHS